MWKYIVLGLGARLFLLLYGEWQDQTMDVKFTDVDYYVFDDAAAFVYEGKSPYERATYRYTPLLAFMLLPNRWFKSFGKLLFITCDVLTGVLIYSIFRSNNHKPSTAALCSCLWLLNPLPMTVSARGNAESIMSLLVLATLDLLQRRKVITSAITYGLAVHFKIYPIAYSLPIYLLLGRYFNNRTFQRTTRTKFTQLKEKQKESCCSVVNSLKDLLPNTNRLKFMAVSCTVLFGLTGLFYIWYGWEFLYETYIYHVVRQDTRHNFSPYFYMLYLLGASDTTAWMKILMFLPQVLFIITFGAKFYKDPPFCWFLITFAFVALNKVCTSQYFLWYLCLLPFLLPTVDISSFHTTVLTVLWFLGQGVWLLPAFYLEFEGINTFIYIWGAGLVFFTINIYILYTIVINYQPLHQMKKMS